MNQDKHKISVRLNGKEQTLKRETQDRIQVDSEVFSNEQVRSEEIVPTREQEEIDVAEIIPQPDNVIHFEKKHEERKRNGQPFWDDGNREKSPKLPFKRKKKSATNNSRPKIPLMMVVAVCSAIIVGLGFGTMILTVFKGSSVPVVQGVEQEEATQAAASVDATVEGTALPTLSIEVVQGAAFTELAQGEEVVARIHEQGLAGTLTKGTDPIYMFIGAGGDRAQATKIGSLYEEYGQDTYLKSYQVDGQDITGQAEEVSAWFTNAIDHYKKVMQLSVDGLNGGSLITTESVKSIEENAQALQAERDVAFSHLTGDSQQHALEMGDKLVLAGQKLKEYESKGEQDALWQSQQAILDALVSYEQVVQSLQ
ncbi:hypothetical protein [Halalkalibacter krulwichiae]|uniref:Stage II sporulation protein B n=1 Tax=Halalkalibacter krulwichiae TaxID=199441 RepID=A0A1X9MDS3_9BACI|nr:hypothetical protein [Halalkalibacter krulwichiae]ARK31595.1 hypothetical protein BkAM31D_18055 [Halalkalibacter krulwichiae]